MNSPECPSECVKCAAYEKEIARLNLALFWCQREGYDLPSPATLTAFEKQLAEEDAAEEQS